MQDPRSLRVFIEAEDLALLVYEITRGFPKEEQFGLTRQMRRAAVSIGSNIAEGCGRGGARELSRYLRMAVASAMELEYQLRLAKRLAYLEDMTHREADVALRALQRKLARFLSRLRPATDASRGRPKTENR